MLGRNSFIGRAHPWSDQGRRSISPVVQEGDPDVDQQPDWSRSLWEAHMELKLHEWRQSMRCRQPETVYGHLLRRILAYLIRLSQLNAANSEEFGPSVERSHLPCWSKLVELYSVYFSVRLSMCALAQHNYDRLSSRLASISLRASTWAELDERELQKQQVTDELRGSIEWLDLVGSPWRECKHPLEAWYVVVLVFVNSFHFIPRWINDQCGRKSVSMFRFILNPDVERSSINKEICQLAQRLLWSSENYFSRFCLHGKCRAAGLNSGLFHAGDFLCNCGKFNADITHSILVQDTTQLVVSGRLEPLNRNSRWLNTLELLAGVLLSYVTLLGSMWILLLLFVFPFYVEADFHYHLGLSDCWLFIDMILALMIGLQMASFHIQMLVLIMIDQTKFANELSALIQETIWIVDRTGFALMNVQKTSSNKRLTAMRALNKDVMTILFQVKMFRAQLATTRRAKGFAMSLIIMLMITTPILERASIVHMNDQAKLVALFGSLVVIIIDDTIMWPSCHSYARCLHIQRGLSSLLAHLVGATHFGGQELRSSWSASGLSHSQWLLRKDLNLPDGMVEKFATETLFGKLTYNKAIGVHLWCGILLLSLWLKGAGSTGNLLVDSLWIF